MAATQGFRRFVREPNVPYDGQFTFARLSYTVYGRSGWEYDYPAMERNLMTMLEELTDDQSARPGQQHPHAGRPELLKFPVAYLSEPGYWIPATPRSLGLRNYIVKGGFLIVDDFYPQRVGGLRAAMMRVLPKARSKARCQHPVFQSFFEIKSLEVPYPGGSASAG